MHKLKFLAYALLVAAFSGGCTGTGVNSAEVFKPQSGTIDLNVSNLPDPQAYTQVAFEVDGKPLGTDTDFADGGWSYKLDSTTLTNGIHNVRAVGTTTTGTTTELLNNSIYIDNAGGGSATQPTASASPEGGDTSGGGDTTGGEATGNGDTPDATESQFKRR